MVVVEIDYVEVGAKGELLRDGAGEAVRGEVEDGEIDEVLEVRRDGAGEGVGGEVEGLKVGATGYIWGKGAFEREVREREFVNAAVVAGGAFEERVEALTRVGEGGFCPVLELF